MALFEFDKIIISKYKKYVIKNKSCFKSPINFDEFKKIGLDKIHVIFNFYFTGISKDYIDGLITRDKVKIAFICLGEKFLLEDIVSIIIFHKTISLNKIKYYLLAFGIHKKFRKFGYGKYSLDEFIKWIKLSNIKSKQCLLLLKSLESSLVFYLSYGFIQTDLKTNKLFYKYEPNDELKLNQEKILCYLIL